MHAVTSALARGEYGVNRRGTAEAEGADDFFRQIFGEKLLKKDGASGGIQAMLDSLSQRFPNISVKSADAGADGAAAQKPQEEDGGGDQAAVAGSLLESMFGNSALAKMVEDSIAAFLDRGSDSNLMQFDGAVVQRSLSISITTIRYSESHYAGEGGELLGASDLRTGFHERLSEIIKEFFGAAQAGSEEADAGEAGAEDAGKKAQNTGAGTAMWSLELFYSSTYISSLAQSQNGGQDAAGYQASSWSFSASFAQSLTSSLLPQGLAGASGSQSSMSEFLRDTLAGLGLESDGFKSVQGGYSVNLRQRRNLLAELMEMYQDKVRQLTDESEYAEDPAKEAEAVEEVPETAAV